MVIGVGDKNRDDIDALAQETFENNAYQNNPGRASSENSDLRDCFAQDRQTELKRSKKLACVDFYQKLLEKWLNVFLSLARRLLLLTLPLSFFCSIFGFNHLEEAIFEIIKKLIELFNKINILGLGLAALTCLPFLALQLVRLIVKNN